MDGLGIDSRSSPGLNVNRLALEVLHAGDLAVLGHGQADPVSVVGVAEVDGLLSFFSHAHAGDHPVDLARLQGLDVGVEGHDLQLVLEVFVLGDFPEDFDVNPRVLAIVGTILVLDFKGLESLVGADDVSLLASSLGLGRR